ncbi:MAG: response regulator, partial [Flavobacteriaceae bacterium]|nr:response regulator [Flavobacteriaceae bacterium]
MNIQDFTIVCVDDDTDVLDVTMAKIEDLGHKSIGFSRPQEAIDYITKNKHNVSLIVSDLRMDHMNGFDFKKALKKIADDIPFVIITGYWTKEISSEAMEIGVEAFIEKPISDDILKNYVEKFANVRAELLLEEREMVDGFLQESSPMLDEIEQLILELEEDPESEQTLSIYFRLLHTIKGTASCVGLNRLGEYTHQYEDFIGELRNRTIPVNAITTDVLLSGLDDLKIYFDQVEKEKIDINLDVEKRISKYDITNLTNSDIALDDVKDSGKMDATKKQSKSKKDDDKMTVPMSILNNFMEESGELTVIRNSILKTVKKIEVKYRGDKEIEMLNELLDGMHTVTSNIQGKITEMRKSSLKNTFRPFKRLIRDLSKQLGKSVDLQIDGEDICVDNVITKLYSNTLIHLLRNSLDHGLETPDDREAAGKNPTGLLKISVAEDGDDIVLKIIDDGNGINPEFIRSKVLEKELYTEEQLSAMSDLEIINIIFASGFSTAEVVSDLSG